MKGQFWKEKTLSELSEKEWESLCDGCGKCCVHKLQDPITQEVSFTWVHCKLLDPQTCRCQDYPNRLEKVPSCLKISAQNIQTIAPALPRTCAYRLLHEGRDLYEWHPLISGDIQSVHDFEISIKDIAIHEEELDEDDLDLFLVDDESF